MKTSIVFQFLLASLLYKSDVLGHDIAAGHSKIIIKPLMSLEKSSKAIQVDPRLLSLSIEQSFFIDFSGTTHSPNVFSQTLINYLKNIHGFAPAIRVGGNTQDRTKYDPNVDVIVIDSYDIKTSTPEAAKLRIGPGFFEAFKNLIQNIHLNHGLEHVELGNEVDLYNTSIRSPWSAKLYAKQCTDFAKRLEKDKPFGNILQLGAVGHGPKHPASKTYPHPWPAKQILKDGIDTSHANAWSSHFYPQSACSPKYLAQLSYTNLTSHSVIKANLDQFKDDIAAVHSKGLSFIIGEGNSVVCHGVDGMSNAFVSAIWALDHVFYGSTIGIQRFYMHNGRNFFYNVFQPNGTKKGVRPLYYAYVLAAEAIGPKTYISPISLTPSRNNLVMYGLYEDMKLKKMVVINSEIYNATSSGKRPSMTIQFKGHSGTFRRLTGPGANAKTGVTYSGLSFSDKTGKVIGTAVQEKWSDSFVLKATEAALVFISK